MGWFPGKVELRMEIQVKTGSEVRLLNVKRGENLMEVLQRHGVTLPHSCHEKGKCGKCHVRISAWGEQVDKTLVKPKESTRLACMTVVNEPISVQVGPKVSLGLQAESPAIGKTRDKESSTAIGKTRDKESSLFARQSNRNPSPPFHRICAVIPGADASRGSPWARLISGFTGKDRKSLQRERDWVLPLLPKILPASGGPLTLTRAGRRFFALEAGDSTRQRLGAAFFVSDESVSAVLAGFDDGKSLESASMKLPNNHAAEAGILDGKVLISAVNGLVEALCTKSGKKATDISDAVIAGSSSVLYAMTELIMNKADLSVWVGDRRSPVIPSQQWVRADKLGLGLGRHAGVWFPPAASVAHGPKKEVFASTGMAGALSCLLDGRSRKKAVKYAKNQTKAGKR